MSQKITRYLACGMLLVLLVCGAAVTVRADSKPKEPQFETDVVMVPGAEDAAYSLQVNITNHGADFEGHVRILSQSDANGVSAFDTPIALPKDGTKQFVVKIPKQAVANARARLTVAMVNKKGKVIENEQKTGIFANSVIGMPVGILSDNYSALSYLDLGGDTVWLSSDDFPIALTEVTPERIPDLLENIRFLVIDHFNVESLEQEKIRAIQDWVNEGGILIVGTGAYANETLSGFDADFIGASCRTILKPGDITVSPIDYPKIDEDSEVAMQGLDVTQMTIADLTTSADYWTSWRCYGLERDQSKGSILLLYYGLDDAYFTDKANDGTTGDVNNIVSEMYSAASSNSMAFEKNMGYSSGLDLDEMFERIDSCNATVHFLALKIIVVLYVVLIGPVIYLILMKCRKREWYWIAVPVMAVVFIGVVYLAGRGFKVDRTTVYSISVADASGEGDTHTYLSAYNAKFGEWRLRLADGCRLPGPASRGNYSYSSDPLEYYYHFAAEPDGVYLGIRQNASFDGAEFDVWRDNPNQGGFSAEAISAGEPYQGADGGRITNNTGKDLEFMGVSANGWLYVFQDVRAGESVDLASTPCYASMQMDMIYYYEFYREIMYDAVARKKDEDVMALSALYAGVAENYEYQSAGCDVAFGVVQDYDKVTGSSCDEISYGCLYTRLMAR